MKNVTLFALALMAMSANQSSVWAQENVSVNLTPIPKEMQVSTGTLRMPDQFTINVNGLADSIKVEADRFAEVYASVSGADVTVANAADDQTLITLSLNSSATNMGPEAYKLNITENAIQIEAETTRGFFYAFQSLKKLLPPCVMAEVKDPNVTEFLLPVVNINDAPRFKYRGYMLDVCRHFFTVDEIKRILDVMAYYKMNKFHWHLTEDQGWRVEIKKYPKLTSVGAVRDFSWNTDYTPGGQRYRTYEPYGPYFYTQEEIKDVVAYAKNLHIDVIPEVDMPGHFSAAMAAYPEFSCTPNGSHVIPCDGGIYSDVMNVANPKAVQFAMDIMDELMDLFPYPYFHIGGDECPTTAWENNKECQDLMRELGYGTNYRKLQSRFIKQLADHAAERGRTLYVWNEAISAGGADTEMIKSTGAKVMCWTGADAAARKAAELGLDNILTPQVPYYICRKAGTHPSEPHAVASGTDTRLDQVYGYVPANGVTDANLLKHYTGVQGTFWTEHVSEAPHVEYLTLPRLMAVAEAGWTPQEKRDFNNFVERMKQDTVLLNYNNYQYAPYFLKDMDAGQKVVMPKASVEGDTVWYRLVTLATDNVRNDKCLELLHEGASQLTEYANNGALVGRLWSGAVAAEGEADYDYQWWALVEDPANAGKYALVCKAKPNGSVNPAPTSNSTSGRFSYDENNVHYGFTLDANECYGTVGENYYYGLKSDQATGNYFNMAAGGQGYSINLYGNPKDGNGGLWEFQPMDPAAAYGLDKILTEAKDLLAHAAYYEGDAVEFGKYSKEKGDALKAAVEKETPVETEVTAALAAMKASLGLPQNGDQVVISNSVPGSYENLTISESEEGFLKTADTDWASNIWVVETAGEGTVALKNLVSGKYISGTSSPLSLATSKTDYKLTHNVSEGDFTLATAEGQAFFPISVDYNTNPGSIYVGGVRPQGAAWDLKKVYQVKFECVDEAGQTIGSYYRAASAGADVTCVAPEITNFSVVGYGEGQATEAPVINAIAQNETVKVTYKRTAYSLKFICKDEHGNIIMDSIATAPVDAAVTIKYPEIPYYQFKEADVEAGEMTPTADTELVAVYTTEAMHTGFKAVGELVTQLEDGKQYLFYNAASSTDRNGFLNVGDNGVIYTSTATAGDPDFVWTLKANGNKFKVETDGGKFIPVLTNGQNITVGTSGDSFTFTLNANQETWKVQGSNGSYWNGNRGSFTGWSDGHDYKIYTFVPVPYFEVDCIYEDQDGNSLTAVEGGKTLVEAGTAYEVATPEIEGYTFVRVEGDAEALKAVGANLQVKVVYKKIDTTGIDEVNVSSDADNKIYDLTGRQIEEIKAKGVYIQNGQKVVK